MLFAIIFRGVEVCFGLGFGPIWMAASGLEVGLVRSRCLDCGVSFMPSFSRSAGLFWFGLLPGLDGSQFRSCPG